MKKLLVISNHDPKNWGDKQKAGWDSIEYFPFPNVNSHKTTADVISDEVTQICGKIGQFYGKCDREKAEGYVCLQGEFTVCYYVFKTLAGEPVNFIFPTTERKVKEYIRDDGSVEKISTFEFVQWR